MYGVSAVQMAHRGWFRLDPAVTETAANLPPGATDARAIARELMDRYGMPGELAQITARPEQIRFRIVRPGTIYEVEYEPGGKTKVRESRANLMGILNRIHHVGGLWHDYWLVNAWGALTGAVALGLIGLSVTGIYLWFKIHTERVTGLVLLAISLGYSLPLIVLMRMAQ